MVRIQRFIEKKEQKIMAKINGVETEIDTVLSFYGDTEEVDDNDPVLQDPETIIIPAESPQ